MTTEQLRVKLYAAISMLHGIDFSMMNNDAQGKEYFASQYAWLIQEIAAPHVETAVKNFLTEAEVDYLFSDGPKPCTGCDLEVDQDGQLSFSKINGE